MCQSALNWKLVGECRELKFLLPEKAGKKSNEENTSARKKNTQNDNKLRRDVRVRRFKFYLDARSLSHIYLIPYYYYCY